MPRHWPRERCGCEGFAASLKLYDPSNQQSRAAVAADPIQDSSKVPTKTLPRGTKTLPACLHGYCQLAHSCHHAILGIGGPSEGGIATNRTGSDKECLICVGPSAADSEDGNFRVVPVPQCCGGNPTSYTGNHPTVVHNIYWGIASLLNLERSL